MSFVLNTSTLSPFSLNFLRQLESKKRVRLYRAAAANMIGVLCRWKASCCPAFVGFTPGLKLLAIDRTFDSCLKALDFENSFCSTVEAYSLQAVRQALKDTYSWPAFSLKTTGL